MKDCCVKSFNRVEANFRSQTICFSHTGWSPDGFTKYFYQLLW